jgi:hypothetical protein
VNNGLVGGVCKYRYIKMSSRVGIALMALDNIARAAGAKKSPI